MIKKAFIFLLIMLTMQAAYSQNKLLSKALSKGLTVKIADLSTASMQAAYITNLHSSLIETSTSKIFKEQWGEGKNQVMLVTTKREGSGFCEIDGEVTIDGQPAPYMGFGIYGKIVDPSDQSAHSILVKTSKGQTANFEVAPSVPIKIETINGTKDKMVIDPEKDLEITLNNPNPNDGSRLIVKLYVKHAGVGYFNDIYVSESTNKIVVPKEAFLHPGFIVGGSGYSNESESTSLSNSLVPNFEVGDSYLMIERYTVKPEKIDGVGASQQLALAWDVKPINFKRSRENRYYCLRVKDDDKKTNMSYSIEKPNAFLGPPLSSGKKFAISSVIINATLSATDVKETESATIWKTKYFPELPAEYWESLVNKTYEVVKSYFEKSFNDEIIPFEQVTTSASYQKLPEVEDVQEKNLARYVYNGSKSLIPRGIDKLKQQMNTTFASDRIDARLCNELGVDGLIAIRLDLVFDFNEETLVPELNFKVSGAPKTYNEGPIIYTQGVVTGIGMKMKKAKKESSTFEDYLANVIRLNDLMTTWDDALKIQAEKEKEYGYCKLWNCR